MLSNFGTLLSFFSTMPAQLPASRVGIYSYKHFFTHRKRHQCAYLIQFSPFSPKIASCFVLLRERELVYTLRPKLIVLRPRHKTLADTLVDDEDDLRCNLRSQEVCLLKADFFPLWEILCHFGQLDARWSLAVV